jgi:hypothetical protein
MPQDHIHPFRRAVPNSVSLLGNITLFNFLSGDAPRRLPRGGLVKEGVGQLHWASLHSARFKLHLQSSKTWKTYTSCSSKIIGRYLSFVLLQHALSMFDPAMLQPT